MYQRQTGGSVGGLIGLFRDRDPQSSGPKKTHPVPPPPIRGGGLGSWCNVGPGRLYSAEELCTDVGGFRLISLSVGIW